MDSIYSINVAAVVSEVIDGEAVMLHRVSGDYFSTDGIGCLVWQWVGDGQSRDRIVKTLKTKFEADPAEIEMAVDAFLAELVAHELVREIGRDTGSQAETGIESQPQARPVFARPILHVYSDIRRMLLLDPIHDVAQTGWPAPKPADERA
jgi:hypothetical protein